MRIVTVADTHNRHDQVNVPDGNVFVFAGDMCGVGNEKEVKSFGAFLDKLPHEHKIVIAGNHDWPFEERDDAEDLLPECIYLQDESVIIDGIKFYGAPWQPEFCNWAFNLPRGEKLTEKWAKIDEDTDVLITHGPPHGIMDKAPRQRYTFGGGKFFKSVGCRELTKRVKGVKPKLHVFGHIHEGHGVESDAHTVYANVSFAGVGDAPLVFDVDNEEIMRP